MSPEVGEIRKLREIWPDKVAKNRAQQYIWRKCAGCGECSWVQLRRGIPQSVRCRSCAKKLQDRRFGPANKNWKGGRLFRRGYVFIRIYPNDSYFPMANTMGYIPEHRLVMARHLGRCLLPIESVHHLNGDKGDNRIENLELVSPANHALCSSLCSHCELRKEIRLLRWQIRELQNALQLRLGEER